MWCRACKLLGLPNVAKRVYKGPQHGDVGPREDTVISSLIIPVNLEDFAETALVALSTAVAYLLKAPT